MKNAYFAKRSKTNRRGEIHFFLLIIRCAVIFVLLAVLSGCGNNIETAETLTKETEAGIRTVEEQHKPDAADHETTLEKISWAATYLEKTEAAMKEDDHAKAILHDLNEDGIPELIIAQVADLLEEESDFGWDVYSIYSFQNGEIITVEEYKSICPVGMCNDSTVDIVYHNGQAQLLVQSVDVDYYVEHEDGVFNEFTNTRTIYSFNGLDIVEEYEILIDAHKKDDSDNRENKEEKIYFYIDGRTVQHKDVQAVLNDYTGIYRDTMYFFDYLDYKSEEAVAISYLHNYLLKETSASKDTVSIANVIQDWLPFATYAMSDTEKVFSYSDSTLSRQTDWYYFNSRTDEIVIVDVSSDGKALYVRYPSTTSDVGYRDRWFATADIFGPIVENPQIFNAESGTKVYRRERNDSLCYYGTVWIPPECLSLGYHATEKHLVIYSTGYTRPCLGFDITTQMGLVPGR